MPAGDWSEAAADWWSTWATSPQAGSFAATDWLRLRMVLPLVERYFAEPNRQDLAEIRLNEARLGGTLEDRNRNRIKLEAAEPDHAPTGRYDHITEDK